MRLAIAGWMAMASMATAAGGAEGAGGVSVWVCPGEYKPSPAAESVVGFKGKRENLRKANAVFERGRVRLFAARAEDVGFQVVFERAGGKAVKGLDVQVSAFSGGLKAEVKLHLIGYTMSKGAERNGQSQEIPWSPDACVPFETPGAHPFSIPADLAGLPTPPKQLTQAVWVDIYVPRAAKAGTYTATVAASRAGQTIASFPLELTVWPIEIPVERAFEAEFNAYRCAFANHWQLDPTSDRYVALEHRFLRACDDHRTVMNIMPYHGQQGFAYRGRAPILAGAGKTLHVKDWTAYDKRFGPVFDGTLFRDGRPIGAMYLPFNLEWPEPLRNWRPTTREKRWHSLWVANMSDYPRPAYQWNRHTPAQQEAYETAYLNVLKEWIAHARRKGWTRTEFQVYFNQKPQKKKAGSDLGPNRATNRYDEWAVPEDLTALKYYLDLTKRATAGVRDVDVAFRVDISRFTGGPGMERYGRPGHQFDKLDGPKRLGAVDSWYVGMHSYRFEACQKACIALSKRGKSMNVYGAVPAIDADTAIECRRQFIRMWLAGIRRYLAWTGTMWDYDDPFGASVGTLHMIYPGQPVGFDGPVMSIRMKHWRRAVLDVEYLDLAARKLGREEAEEMAEQVLRKSSPTAWIEFRRQVAEAVGG